MDVQRDVEGLLWISPGKIQDQRLAVTLLLLASSRLALTKELPYYGAEAVQDMAADVLFCVCLVLNYKRLTILEAQIAIPASAPNLHSAIWHIHQLYAVCTTELPSEMVRTSIGHVLAYLESYSLERVIERVVERLRSPETSLRSTIDLVKQLRRRG